MQRFADRRDAGRRLAQELLRREPVTAFDVVLGLPRGGVVVAAEVARLLGRPLDVVVVRKIGAPGRPELGMGAVAEGGVSVVNEALVRHLGVDAETLEACTRSELAEAVRRLGAYVGVRPRVPLAGRRVLVVDDGLATGYTALAAVACVRSRGAARVGLAVPVASREAAALLAEACDDDVVCLAVPRRFLAVGSAYRQFAQTTDAEVVEALSAG